MGKRERDNVCVVEREREREKENMCDHYVNIIMYAMWLYAYNIRGGRFVYSTQLLNLTLQCCYCYCCSIIIIIDVVVVFFVVLGCEKESTTMKNGEAVAVVEREER